MKESVPLDRVTNRVVSTDDLREDIAVEASNIEKRLIIANFPDEKEGYLVVPKVIDE